VPVFCRANTVVVTKSSYALSSDGDASGRVHGRPLDVRLTVVDASRVVVVDTQSIVTDNVYVYSAVALRLGGDSFAADRLMMRGNMYRVF